jgi:hypothetical protein
MIKQRLHAVTGVPDNVLEFHYVLTRETTFLFVLGHVVGKKKK